MALYDVKSTAELVLRLKNAVEMLQKAIGLCRQAETYVQRRILDDDTSLGDIYDGAHLILDSAKNLRDQVVTDINALAFVYPVVVRVGLCGITHFNFQDTNPDQVTAVGTASSGKEMGGFQANDVVTISDAEDAGNDQDIVVDSLAAGDTTIVVSESFTANATDTTAVFTLKQREI